MLIKGLHASTVFIYLVVIHFSVYTLYMQQKRAANLKLNFLNFRRKILSAKYFYTY